MTDQVLQTEGRGLSQIERVVDTFIAPTQTFTDILRSTSWWLPVLLVVAFTTLYAFSIDAKVGYPSVAESQVSASSAQQSAMDSLTPQEREHRMSLMANIMRGSLYAGGVFVVPLVLLEAVILWAIFNFALGAATRFWQVTAVVCYSALPRSLMYVVASVLLFAGVGTENFNLKNPVGTNLGYYLQDAPKWVSAAGQFLDVFGLWSLALLVTGMAIISGKKVSSSAAVILTIWFLVLLVVTGIAAVAG